MAQIVGALATVGALIYLTRQTRHAQDAVTEAQRMHQLESDREIRALKYDAQRQAAQVLTWPVKAEFQGKKQWGLLIVNASAAPVFGVNIKRGELTDPGKTPITALQAKAEVLAPGRYFVGDRSRWPELMSDQDKAEPITGSAGYLGSLEFKDCNGRNWRRKSSGVLEELAGEPAV